jgi:hypothetical protein
MAASKSSSKTTAKSVSKTASKVGGAQRGTSDVSYNLISVIYHALQGAETYGVYANDAEQDGNAQLAAFFREVQQDSLDRADRAKALLKRHL